MKRILIVIEVIEPAVKCRRFDSKILFIYNMELDDSKPSQ